PVRWVVRPRAATTRTRGAGRRALIGLVATLVCACSGALPGPANAGAPPRLGVSAAALIDESTGQELYGVSPDSRRAIASTTKLMTALITVEHVHLSHVFTQN